MAKTFWVLSLNFDSFVQTNKIHSSNDLSPKTPTVKQLNYSRCAVENVRK